jgi:chromosome segregation ATPase
MANFIERLKKKKHIRSKILITKKKLWDLEFYRKQLENEREGFRSEYDRIKESIDAAQLRLRGENEKEDPDKTIVDNLENLIKRYTPDLEQLKAQMQAIDMQVDGYDQQGDGDEKTHKEGVKSAIDQHRSLIGLLHEYHDSL